MATQKDSLQNLLLWLIPIMGKHMKRIGLKLLSIFMN